jgi:transcriptional regulator with XRE-family HTH domain
MANGQRQAAWEFFGSELKRRREEAGLTQDALGRRVFVSGGYIGQFEQAIRKPQLDVAIRIDEALQSDRFFERMWRKLIGASPFESYFAAVAELEALATEICEFEPVLVPGLLQTAGYARALMLAAEPFESEEAREQRIAARLARAHILKDSTKPLYWAIVHEQMLRIPVGGAACMAMQLDHVSGLAHSHRVMVQVIASAEGAHAAMNHPLRLMEFDDAPPTLYTEGLFWGQLLDDPSLVKHARAKYDLLRAAALSPKASLALIDSAAESYRTP